MDTVTKITQDKAFDQDVKTMSYDELMETIRFLDHEREKICKSVETRIQKSANHNEVLKHAA